VGAKGDGRPPAGSYRGALTSPAYRWLLAVFALSGVGQTVGTIAVTTVVYERTG
jgi:hypothetical protein